MARDQIWVSWWMVYDLSPSTTTSHWSSRATATKNSYAWQASLRALVGAGGPRAPRLSSTPPPPSLSTALPQLLLLSK
eukprot:scaffold80914_cov30-Tisochrysis_lutea.AAC.2